MLKVTQEEKEFGLTALRTPKTEEEQAEKDGLERLCGGESDKLAIDALYRLISLGYVRPFGCNGNDEIPESVETLELCKIIGMKGIKDGNE